MTPQKVKKTPMRECLGCNEHKPKNELMRIVRLPDGTVALDVTGKKSGRGAYICHSLSCFRKVRKNHRVEHTLECSIPEDLWDKMEQELSEI